MTTKRRLGERLDRLAEQHRRLTPEQRPGVAAVRTVAGGATVDVDAEAERQLRRPLRAGDTIIVTRRIPAAGAGSGTAA